MQKLVELKKVVYAELVENEQARRNDMELLLGVFKRLGIDTRKSFYINNRLSNLYYILYIKAIYKR